ncbi:MAG: hypothetical protein GXO16_09170 [Epsilonproteobacteria bacterium]|nr:hypothetical protein [Campylobacterota bacterium]
MRFRLFFALLAIFIGLWTLFFKPVEVAPHKVSDAWIKFERFSFVALTPRGRELALQGLSAKALGDRLLLSDITLYKDDLTLQADEANYTDDVLELSQDISLRSKEYTLLCDKARYYLKGGIIQILSPFEFRSQRLWAKGKRGVVYLKERKIKAYKIQAKVEI